MLDPHLLRNEPDAVAEKLARRGFKLDVKMITLLEERRKVLQVTTENLQAERNVRSKFIGQAKARGEDVKLLCQEVNTINERLNKKRAELEVLQNNIRDFFLTLPNLPADEVPFGQDETDNQEVSRWGNPRLFVFPIRDHVDLGEMIEGLDFAAAVKLTGSRFVVLHGQIACLHRALSHFMLDLHTQKHGYNETYVPYLVNHTTLYSTGQLPKFGEDIFHICPFKEEMNNSNYALIPTAEVPLTNLVRDMMVEEELLPIKFTAHTPCFRAEAGSYGRSQRGMIRMHQFDKVELVQIVCPEYSMQALEELVGHAEKVLQLLNLPYRKVLLCSSSMAASAAKTYDLEVWLPAQNAYREISSCSNMWDFQARRMQTRCINKNKKQRLVHTLNGSGLAVGRTLVAVMENYQQVDGRIEVPEVLQPYMNGLKIIG